MIDFGGWMATGAGLLAATRRATLRVPVRDKDGDRIVEIGIPSPGTREAA